MIYLVAEDSDTGYELWKSIIAELTSKNIHDVMYIEIKTVIKDGKKHKEKVKRIDWDKVESLKSTNSDDVIALSSVGNLGLISTITKLKLCATDFLILVYDNIPIIAEDIKDIKRDVRDAECGLLYTKYYCIEKALLSFKHLNCFLQTEVREKSKEKDKKVLEFIQKWRDKGCTEHALISVMEEYKKDYISDMEVSNTQGKKVTKYKLKEYDLEFLGLGKEFTLEKLYYAMLVKLTELSKIHAKVTKSSIGECWWKNCSDTDCYTNNLCEKCKLHNKNLSAKRKFYMLNSGSILKLNEIRLKDINKIINDFLNNHL